MKVLVLLSLSLLTVSVAQPSQLALPANTGVMDGGLAAAGTVDANYSSPNSPVFVLTGPADWGGWVGPDSKSSWVGPDSTNGAMFNWGQYTVDYVVMFDTTGYSSVSLSGIASVDNTLDDIKINGDSTGITWSGFNAWSAFTLTGFNDGLNEIDFQWTDSGGPGGLRVEFTGVTDTSDTPEAPTILLFGFGVGSLALVRAKRP